MYSFLQVVSLTGLENGEFKVPRKENVGLDKLSNHFLGFECLRGCLPKILIPILDHITDFLETLHVSYTL